MASSSSQQEPRRRPYDADRIAVLEDGVLTALGTHGALARGDGWYARLAERQGTA